ncbi:hypothetical protein NP233_g443 [Leucocoprinus birnbaumii]|uniref:CxC2-like cysteine cluster KDZ transposase-associated domain-containing protein n=1 Tax=Leucocoprinus birnbaumii TaxID=56174 RepID=A0AAD5W425_9AGAR|nr:hypothetical protein NP233_g443 [Leucocoprinus birnbaumii]
MQSLPVLQPPQLVHWRHILYLMARTPCDRTGRDLPPGTAPTPEQPAPGEEFYPFSDRADFMLADFFYTRNQMPAIGIDTLMDTWALKHPDTGPLFADHHNLYEAIDSIQLTDVPWKSFAVSYSGELPDEEDTEIPPWMTAEYEVWYRDPLAVLESQLSNPDFNRFGGDVMSGNWAWAQADLIAKGDEATHRAMFVLVILGSNKTTVSVATGQNEYYPLYISNGVVTNGARRVHKNAVLLLGFLAIPKTDRKYTNSDHFCQFRCQLFHGSIRAILEPLHSAMLEPRVTKCPDRHYRCAIYGIGPYIADYPEQCILASIVSDWCPRCTGKPDDLDGPSLPHTQGYTELLVKYLDLKTLWNNYGIAAEAEPFTTSFPHASIYKLVTSDLLHQVIKGTFKDHLVMWVGEWLEMEHGKSGAAAIMADIDRRIAAAPSFPGLGRFPEGQGFKQWTGNDSKALMKVYLPAIAEHVPAQMVRTLAAFLDFCYLVRRSLHSEMTLKQIQAALQNFHRERVVFEELSVRPGGLSVPRQHSLSHYFEVIQLFDSPNGLCSSITESKHIKALESQGLLSRSLAAVEGAEVVKETDPFEKEGEAVNGVRDVDNDVFLALTKAHGYPKRVEKLAVHINIPSLPLLVGRFLHAQLHPNSEQPWTSLPLHALPSADPRSFKVFHSAVVS